MPDMPLASQSSQLAHRLEAHTLPFLTTLLGRFGGDPWEVPFTFQTFDDEKPRGLARQFLARVLHAPLAELHQELDRLNRLGAGVFVTINQTDGCRKKANIRALRGWWADLDDKAAQRALNLAQLHPAPTMVVESGHGLHLYWIAPVAMPCGDDPFRRASHEAELRVIATALGLFGADRAVCDVSRVMRLPGFFNRKKAPFPLVRWASKPCAYVGREAIQRSFPSEIVEVSRQDKTKFCGDQVFGAQEVLKRAECYLDKLPAAVQGQNGSRTTFNTALKLMGGFDLSEDETFFLMEGRFNPRCVPPWSLPELRKKVRDAAACCKVRGRLLGSPQ